jgi:hypothetical protein
MTKKELETKADRKFKALQKKNLPYGLVWLSQFGDFLDWYQAELKKIEKS